MNCSSGCASDVNRRVSNFIHLAPFFVPRCHFQVQVDLRGSLSEGSDGIDSIFTLVMGNVSDKASSATRMRDPKRENDFRMPRRSAD